METNLKRSDFRKVMTGADFQMVTTGSPKSYLICALCTSNAKAAVKFLVWSHNPAAMGAGKTRLGRVFLPWLFTNTGIWKYDWMYSFSINALLPYPVITEEIWEGIQGWISGGRPLFIRKKCGIPVEHGFLGRWREMTLGDSNTVELPVFFVRI